MKIKTADLEGNALCYAVCMIEMPHLVWGKTIGLHHASHQIVVPELPEPQCYSPFMGREMAGEIIERERIAVQFGPQWTAVHHKRLGSFYYGTTPLIAAMRGYVASRLGREVDIPEELL